LEVKELEVVADHVHLFIGAQPTESPVGIVKALKGISTRVLFDEHPILRTMFRQGRQWSPSYHIGKVGQVPAEAKARHIRDQMFGGSGDLLPPPNELRVSAGRVS
jgi:putative transposase